MANRRFRLEDNPALASVFIGLIVSAAVIVLVKTQVMVSMELFAYDYFVRMERSGQPEDRVVLIGVTEDDIQRQGRWPLSDGTIADLFDRLEKAGARVIGIDIYRDLAVPPGHDRLQDAFGKYGNIIAVHKFGGDGARGVGPPPALEGTERVGFNDVIIDRDGTVRRSLLFLDDGQSVYFSFPLRLALAYLAEDGVYPRPDETRPEWLKLGGVTIKPLEGSAGGYVGADTRGYQTLLDFDSGDFSRYTLTEALEGAIPPGKLKNKIVIIGVTAESVNDFFHAPYEKGGGAGGAVFGVELHAHAVSQFLRAALEGEELTSSLRDEIELGLIILCGLAGGLLGRFARSPWRFAMFLAAGVALLFLAGLAAFFNGVWTPMVAPATSWPASAAIVTAYVSSREKSQRALLMRLFSSFVSKDVAEDLWRHREHFLDSGRPKPQRLTATALFTDLKGFTTVSEKSEPKELMDWLNEYMEAMAALVADNGGIVNKYIGDAIMAVFGVPIPRESQAQMERDAVNAVKCAVAMRRELERLNKRWRAQGRPVAKMRVGIYTGPLVAGSVGGAERLEYTVIGDTVNTASRLESFDKDLAADSDCRILIGEATRNLIGNMFKVEKVGEVSLKGKKEKVTVYLVPDGQGKRENGPA